jgi:hypothetical protein
MWERAKVDWGRQRPGGTARFEGVKVGNKKRRVDLLNQMGIYVLYDKFEQPIQVRVRGPAGAVAQTHGDGLGKAAGRYSRKGHTQCLLDLDEVGLLSRENHRDICFMVSGRRLNRTRVKRTVYSEVEKPESV